MMIEREVRALPRMPTLCQPNSLLRGLTIMPMTYRRKHSTLKIQAVVMDEAPRSSRYRENRMPKHGLSCSTRV